MPSPVGEKTPQVSTKAPPIVVSLEERDEDIAMKFVEEELAGMIDLLQQMRVFVVKSGLDRLENVIQSKHLTLRHPSYSPAPVNTDPIPFLFTAHHPILLEDGGW